jgi:hypothetical protein
MMKPKFTDLTPEQQASYGNGCGLDARLLRVPQFIFSASCRQHDFNYARGSYEVLVWSSNIIETFPQLSFLSKTIERAEELYMGLRAKAKADKDFFLHMFKDARMSNKPILYSIASVVYLLGVSFNPVAFVAFKWGPYKDLATILKEDREKKGSK